MRNEPTREEFIFRCLNAAANLYGVLTIEEFIRIYAEYARAHGGTLADPLTPDEVKVVADERIREAEQEEEGELFADDVWFRVWTHPKTGETFIAYYDIIEDDDGSDEFAEEDVDELRERWVTPDMQILPEAAFLDYEDPMFCEMTPEVKKLAKLFRSVDGKDMAEINAFAVQSHMRVNGATVANGIEYINDNLEYRPDTEGEYQKLVDVLSRLVGVTRTWDYRGHTDQELAEADVLKRYRAERIPAFEQAFDADDDDYDDGDDEDADYEDDDEDEFETHFFDRDDELDLSTLPPAKFVGPVDFRFVKDAEKREAVLTDYRHVRALTQSFVRDIVMREMTPDERRAAARRLGFVKSSGRDLARVGSNHDMVAGDFGSMMDDQGGEPAIRRILARKDKLDERDRRAAEYYENYRYTWLEVLAVKSGVGLKCRDLLTGEELFLMEMSLSQSPNVKGMTFCAGIAPMGSVYLALGVLQPADFENPATILKIVLTHLKLPTELPIRLSFSDQARFAEETIHRLDANGRI